MDPTTQGQQATADGVADSQSGDQGASAQVNQKSNPLPGVEARIGELTANWRQTQEALQHQARENEQLRAQLQAQLNQQQQQVQQAAIAQLDPAVKAAFDTMFAPMIQQLQTQNRQLQQQVGARFAGLEVQQAASGFDPSVAQRAQAIVNHYAQQGQVVDPAFAVDLALGQLAREGKSVVAASNAARQAGNAVAGAGVSGAQRVPGVGQGAGGPQWVDEAVVASWSPDRQMKHWEDLAKASVGYGLLPTNGNDFT